MQSPHPRTRAVLEYFTEKTGKISHLAPETHSKFGWTSNEKGNNIASMAKIEIKYDSSLSADETYGKIKDLIGDNKDLKSIDKNYSFSMDDGARSASAKGKGFDAEMSVEESGGTSTVKFSIKVGLMLSPFKGVIEEKLKAKLEKVLG